MSIWSNSIIIQQPIINTSLGWAADSKYLVYDEGALLGRMSTESFDRTFTKEYPGYTISIWLLDRSSDWCGPILISTDYLAVRYYCKDIKNAGFSASLGHNNYFSYLGLRWYVNTQYHLHNNSNFQVIDYANRPVINLSGGGVNWPQILEQAGVRLI